MPAELTAVRLNWEDVSINENQLKPDAEIEKVVEALLYGDSTSEHMGEVGQRIDFTATVVKAIPIENYFGSQTLHIFQTPEGNIATWLTGARTLEVGTVHEMRGTIKSLDTYKGTKQTVMTRCTVR